MRATEARREHLQELHSNPEGLAWSKRYSQWVQRCVAEIAEEAILPADGERLCVVASGSCARGEMSPHSDIDLAIIPWVDDPETIRQSVSDFNRRIHELFMDALKLKVDLALRPIPDIAALNHVSLAGMMDAVQVWGSRPAFEAYRKSLKEEFPTGDFVLAKLDEHRRDIMKTSESPLCVQPHLKLGAGGLRTAQAADWISRALDLRQPNLSLSKDVLLLVKNTIQCLDGSAAEVLSPRLTQLCAEALGTTPQGLLDKLLPEMVQIEHAFEATVNRIRRAPFVLRPGVRAESGHMTVEADTPVSQAAFAVAIGVRLGLTGPDWAEDCLPDIDGDRALRALTMGEPTLRRIAECGLLKELLPELEACRTLISDDISHRYTVLEHSIVAAKHVQEARDHGGFIASALGRVDHSDVLVLAALLHDVGKQLPGRPHEEVGAEMARIACERWGLEGYISDRLVWVVRHHLLLAQAIQTRDIHHEDTATDLLKLIPDADHLAMLTVFTWADTRAVAPEIWTPMQESLLEALYRRLLHQIEQQHPPSIAGHRKAAAERMAEAEVPQAEIDKFLAELPGSYVLATPPELVHKHYQMVRRALSGNPEVDIRAVREQASSDITLVCPDSPGLLSRALGIVYALDMSISAVRAATLGGDVPVAVDTITAAYRELPIPRGLADRVQDSLLECLPDPKAVDDLLRKCGKSPDRTEEALRIEFRPGCPAIIEFHAKRGRGMGYRLSRRLADIGWNITSARVGQWGGQGVATFYVTSQTGEALEQSDFLAHFGS